MTLVRVDVLEDPEFTRWLALTPEAPPDKPRRGRKTPAGMKPPTPTTLVYNEAGRPYTDDGLGIEVGKLIVQLHPAGRLDTDLYGLHGLRRSARRLFGRRGRGDDGPRQRLQFRAIPPAGRQNPPFGRRGRPPCDAARTRLEQRVQQTLQQKCN